MNHDPSPGSHLLQFLFQICIIIAVSSRCAFAQSIRPASASPTAWRLPLNGSTLLAQSPVSPGTRVLLLLASSDSKSPSDAAILNINAANGAVLWRWSNVDPLVTPRIRAPNLWLVPHSESSMSAGVPTKPLALLSYTDPGSNDITHFVLFSMSDLAAPTRQRWHIPIPFAVRSTHIGSDLFCATSAAADVRCISIASGFVLWSQSLPAMLNDASLYSPTASYAFPSCVRSIRTSGASEQALPADSPFSSLPSSTSSAGTQQLFDAVHLLLATSSGSVSLASIDASTGAHIAIVPLSGAPLALALERPQFSQFAVEWPARRAILAYATNCSASNGPCAGTSVVAFGATNGSLFWRRDFPSRAWSTDQAFVFDWRAHLLIGVLDGLTAQVGALSLFDGLLSWRRPLLPAALNEASWPLNVAASARMRFAVDDSSPQLQQSFLVVDLNVSMNSAFPIGSNQSAAPLLAPSAAQSVLVCAHTGAPAVDIAGAAAAVPLSTYSFSARPALSLTASSSDMWLSVSGWEAAPGNGALALIGFNMNVTAYPSIAQCLLPTSWCPSPRVPSADDADSWFLWWDVENWPILRRSFFLACLACFVFCAIIAACLLKDQNRLAAAAAAAEVEADASFDEAGAFPSGVAASSLAHFDLALDGDDFGDDDVPPSGENMDDIDFPESDAASLELMEPRRSSLYSQQ